MSHEHSHSHEHSDPPSSETLPEPSRSGSVLLDIGGDVGALQLNTSPDLLGEELEIRALGTEWTGEHVAVRERQLPGSVLHAALFPSLVAGSYEVRVRHAASDERRLVVDIVGGHVARATFPDA